MLTKPVRALAQANMPPVSKWASNQIRNYKDNFMLPKQKKSLIHWISSHSLYIGREEMQHKTGESSDSVIHL